MEKLTLWIIIAVIFGIIAGLIFSYSLSRVRYKDDDDNEGARGFRSDVLLNILIFSIIGFLIVWLVSAMVGWNV